VASLLGGGWPTVTAACSSDDIEYNLNEISWAHRTRSRSRSRRDGSKVARWQEASLRLVLGCKTRAAVLAGSTN